MTAPAEPAPQPPTASTAPGSAGQSASPGRRPRTRRNVELGLLGFSMILLLGYSAAMEAGALEEITSDFWVPTAILATIFFLTSLGLAYIATNKPKEGGGVLDAAKKAASEPAKPAEKPAADKAASDVPKTPAVPAEGSKSKTVPQ